MTTQKKNWRLIYWLIAAIILLIPLVAMQFTQEVNWAIMDFVVMGAMLLSLGIGFEALVRLSKNPKNQLIGAIVMIGVFLLIWLQGAVGIF
ncbi:MAG: hypothetical protein HKN88_09800 [Gammaproteobacteria bacterium]|nr:hypothetical protein [Gammaproteobacteria bacterium]NNC98350.1 hypothetical protein [Gammaproteobacteria bacterium]NNM13737.1 hypothetical protein [Gammaproteobacteria bacterium]